MTPPFVLWTVFSLKFHGTVFSLKFHGPSLVSPIPLGCKVFNLSVRLTMFLMDPQWLKTGSGSLQFKS